MIPLRLIATEIDLHKDTNPELTDIINREEHNILERVGKDGVGNKLNFRV